MRRGRHAATIDTHLVEMILLIMTKAESFPSSIMVCCVSSTVSVAPSFR
jgi:hypothetical protein